MKKILSILLTIACTAMVSATGLDSVRIYINPGHGGWNEMNDRHIETIPYPSRTAEGYCDTLGFWESSSNLKVALDLDTLLKAAGATVMMTRYDNRSGVRDNGQMDWDLQYKQYTDDPLIGDRPFSSIKEECNQFNGDVLLSIHSNAANSVGADPNYVCCFLPGTNGDWQWRKNATSQESVEIAEKVYYYMWDNPLDCLKSNEREVANWWSFDSQYSLVTPGCNSPTVLCEASFHSYLPNTHRYLNRDYQRLEAHRFYRALCDHWKADFLPTGIIAGDVRSNNIKETRKGMGSIISQPINQDRAKDRYMALDGSFVELMQDGQVLKTYTVDNCCNGIFAFFDLQPGKYQLRINANHAVEKIIDSVVVSAGYTNTVNVYMTDSDYIRPLTPDYPAQAKDVKVGDKLTFYEYPLTTTAFLDGLTIRRMVVRGEKTYVLDENHNIYIVNTFTGEQIGLVNTTGIEVSDFAFTSDSVLMACNEVTITKSGNEKVTIYQWKDLSQTPEVFQEIHTTTGYDKAIVGSTMAVMGNTWWHRLVFSSISDDSKQLIGIYGYDYMDMDKTHGIQQTLFLKAKNTYTVAKWGKDFKIKVAPTDDNSFFIYDSPSMELAEYYFNWNTSSGSSMEKLNIIKDADINTSSYGVDFVNYGNAYRMIAPVCDDNGLNIGLKLYNIIYNSTSNYMISASKPISDKLPQAGLNTSTPSFMQAGAVVIGDDLNVVVYIQGVGIARYSTAPYTYVEQINATQNFSNQAYDLLGRPVNENYQGIILQNGVKKLQY